MTGTTTLSTKRLLALMAGLALMAASGQAGEGRDGSRQDIPLQRVSSLETENSVPPRTSTIKLAIPSPEALATIRYHMIEVDTTVPGSVIDFTVPDGPQTFIPPPPGVTPEPAPKTLVATSVKPPVSEITALAQDILAMAPPAVSPPPAPLPSLTDPYISTLEPFTTTTTATAPAPKDITVPTPIRQQAFHSRPPRPVQQELLPLPKTSALAGTARAAYGQPPVLPTPGIPIPDIATAPIVTAPGEAVSAMSPASLPAGTIIMSGPVPTTRFVPPRQVVTTAPTPPAPTPPDPRYAPQEREPSDPQSGPGQSSPLKLPIGPFLDKPLGVPLVGTIAAGEVPRPAPKTASVRPPTAPEPAPAPIPDYPESFSLPAALTQEEFAVLQMQGFPTPARPTPRHKRPAPAHVNARASTPPPQPAVERPDPRPARPEPVREPLEESKNVMRPTPRRGQENFTPMREVKSLVGPPDPRLFSTRRR